MHLRILSSGLLVATIGVATASAQAPTTTTTSTTAITQDEIVLQGDTTPRPALPTIEGDTGFWFVPTAETLPAGKFSFSVFRANFDRRQGLTDVNQIGVTGADRPWRSVRAVWLVADGPARSRCATRRSCPTTAGLRRRVARVSVRAPRMVQDARRSGHRRRQVEPALAVARRRDEPRAALHGEVPERLDVGEHQRLGRPPRPGRQP